jgi:hypothetical protein
MLPFMFQLIWPSSFRGGDLKKLANQKQVSSKNEWRATQAKPTEPLVLSLNCMKLRKFYLDL